MSDESKAPTTEEIQITIAIARLAAVKAVAASAAVGSGTEALAFAQAAMALDELIRR